MSISGSVGSGPKAYEGRQNPDGWHHWDWSLPSVTMLVRGEDGCEDP